MKLHILKNTEEVVLIQVSFENRIDRLSHKGFSGKEKFIKVSKGYPAVVTIYDCNSDPFERFSFDEFGYSNTSIEMYNLYNKIVRFLWRNRIQPLNTKEKPETEFEFIQHSESGSLYRIFLGGYKIAHVSSQEEIEKMLGKFEVCLMKKKDNGDKYMKAEFL